MDTRIRKNEICSVGLPRCDFAFSSARSCFIAYGFSESTLEMTIIKKILLEKGILAEEAGGSLAPGQNAFCSKICSKIITSQFCIVIINSDQVDGKEIPNANVNMEYGLMLGFNKLVIPFQKATQKLPFNVAGLDTIKYVSQDFERKATDAIERAIQLTTQVDRIPIDINQMLDLFLMNNNMLVTPINNDGDRSVYQMGAPLGFNLLNDFSATNYMYLGNFTRYRAEVIVWRIEKLQEILRERSNSIPYRVQNGIITEQQAELLKDVFSNLRIIIAVTSDEDKASVLARTSGKGMIVEDISVYSIADIEKTWSDLST